MGKDGADQNSPDSKSTTTGDRSQSDAERSDQERKSSAPGEGRQPSDDSRSGEDDARRPDESGDGKSKPGESGKPSDDGKSSGQGKSQQGKSQQGESRDGKSGEAKQPDQSDSRQGKSSQQGKSSEQGDQQQGKSSEQGKQQDSSQDSGQEQNKSGEPPDRDSQPDSRKDPADDQSSNREAGPEDEGEEKSDQQPQEQRAAEDESAGAESPPPSFSFRELFSGLMGSLGAILKWLFYIAVLLIALYWLFRSWKTVSAAWTKFLKELAELWRRLFGRKPRPEEEAATAEEESKPAPRPFSAFADPFATGMASRYSPDELVEYTFEAVEAWARENGFPREPEQTPHEFARQLAGAAESLGGNSRMLADLYCYVAYAPGRLRADRAEALAQLWQQLRPGSRL